MAAPCEVCAFVKTLFRCFIPGSGKCKSNFVLPRPAPKGGGQSLVLRNAVFGNSDTVMGTGVGNVVTSGTWNGKAG